MASGYALFDGTAGSKIVTPDHASFGITGDLDIRVLLRVAVADNIANLFTFETDPLGVTGGYQLLVDTSAINEFATFGWADGLRSSDVGLIPAGLTRWIRATIDIDNGSGQHVVTFFSSDQPESTDPAAVVWVQYSQDVQAPTTEILVTDATEWWLGNDSYEEVLNGRIYYLEVRNGINGTIVANPDFRDADQKTGDSPTTFTDTTGKVWTFDTAVWVPPDGGGGSSGGRRSRRPRLPRNPNRYV